MPYPAQTDRAAIVRTAQALIEQDGAEQLSLARLAAALGIKAPSLYRHVASRTALLAAVIAQTYEQLFAAYDAALRPAPETLAVPRSRMVAILAAHRAFARANPRCYALAFSATSPELRGDAQQLEQRVLPIQSIMAAISGPERSLAALRGALALVHGFAMLELGEQLRRGGDLDAAFAAAVDAYLAGWDAGEPGSSRE